MNQSFSLSVKALELKKHHPGLQCNTHGDRWKTTNSAGIRLEKMVRHIQDFKNGSTKGMQGEGVWSREGEKGRAGLGV